MKWLRLQHAVWDRREWAAALRPTADAVSHLEAEFSHRYQAPVFALNAARVGLQIALGVFSRARPGRCAVVLPAYICPSVIGAVRAAGLTPIFAAVKADLTLDVSDCERVLQFHGARVLAVLAAHMYACPVDMDALAPVCARANTFLIDDAAHAPGVMHRQRLLGSHGQIGLTSFAQSKTLVTGVRGSGGMLIVNDPTLAAPIAEALAGLPIAQHRTRALMHFYAHYIGPTKLVEWSRFFSHPGARDWYAPARMAPTDAAIARVQLERLDSIIAARKTRLDWYARGLANLPGVALAQYAPGRYLSRCMVRVQRAEIRDDLGRAKIANRAGYSTVAGMLIELPLSVTMCAKDVARVCDIFKAPPLRA